MTDTAAPVANAASATPAATSPAAEPAPAPKSWELKSDGKSRKVTDEAELVRLAQKGMTADSRFEEIAQGRKQMEDFHNSLKADPKGTIKALAKQIGADPRQLTEEILLEIIESENTPAPAPKTAEQQELEDLRARIKAQEDQEADEAKAQAEQHFMQEKSQASDQYLDSIQSALDSVGFIKSEALRDQAVQDAAGYLIQAYDAGYEPDMQDIAEHIKQTHLARVAELLNVGDDSIFDFLPAEFIKRTGKYWFNKTRASSDPFSAPVAAQAAPSTKSDRPLKMSEVKRLEREARK